ncbi:thioredoxin-dependent thiol peroxidase [Putridiphycobacter roseus]|uniref:thioredoxin-dependent peroxiredoxin n=1 Tax=Putridiphycobacter roseus TaxID=2219161 RepID=A0A2W1N3F5_9FLAO|nr:thioredoxin-dependent thiol peroxidase [Putridiphycobacter roseus]PZE18857.1 thioredoxin-dependent thiol peroxidase [Putridiphycobacter roseus]
MTNLTVGDKAPNFKGVDQNGASIALEDFKGKRLVLYFYPKDLTPGCTTQSCNLRDNYADLKKAGFEVVGVSADDEKKHLKFIDKHELPFRLIADTDKKVINDYGIWGPKKFMGKEYDGIHRTTFVIDGEGVIEAVIPKVKTKDHAAQILAVLAEK